MKTQFLLIDDDAINNFITESYLNCFFPDVAARSFTKAAEAINYLEKNRTIPEMHPRYILLDINMPVMNGWDFLDEFYRLKLEDDYVDTQIYLLTSSIYTGDIDRANEHQLVKAYITKPIDEVGLAKIMGRAPEEITG